MGFFSVTKTPVSKNSTAIQQKKKATGKQGCEACGLYKTCITPKMPVTGQGRQGILIIAEAPGKNEDENGTQLVGEAGKTLRKALQAQDIDLDKDCWKTNAIICRPPKNKTPTTKQVSLCHHHLDATIKELKPKKIILLGKIAIQSFLHDRDSVPATEKWVGWQIPDKKYSCWVFPTWHPQYLNYNKDDVVLHKTFNQHIKTAIEWDKLFPDGQCSVTIINNVEQATKYLQEFNDKYAAIDFETSGLKPYSYGHKIYCIAISSKSGTVVFPFFDDVYFIIALTAFLEGPVKKIGHNIKFETIWAKKIWNIDIKNWYADTCIDTHIRDNRTGITGLKFQTYVNFGVINYNKQVEPYITALSSNEFNRLDEVDPDILMSYCGYDAYYTYRLFKKYPERTVANQFFLQGQLALAQVELNGLCIDRAYYESQSELLERKMKRIEKQIAESYEVKQWHEHYTESFNFNSNKQLAAMLFEILGHVPEKRTAKDNASIDEEVLQSINTPFTNKIVEHKKLHKLKNTYIKNFLEETDAGMMHPNFNLNLVRTYRSSSSNPNFQNIPNRDAEAQKMMRRGIIPRQGNLLLEADYSGIEVRLSACYHKDQAMIKYIEDPTTDMHRDMAREIFCTDEVSKQQRYIAKNKFVFPQFYGDYYKNCATNIWNESEKGMLPFKSYDTFENHMQKVENKFWNERFAVYNEWKKKTYKQYLKTGQVEFYTGFICKEIMRKNEVLNRAIQGTAFHCLLWSLIQMQQFITNNKLQSKIIGQIHDSMIIDVVPDELSIITAALKKIMCQDIREHWQWIIVPLDIEIEITEINQSWYTKKKLEESNEL